MSANLRSTLKYLAFISNIKCNKTQRTLLAYLSKDKKYQKSIKELALNIINGNIKVNNKTKNKIKRFTKVIYSCKKPNKKNIIQSGGWLHWVVPIVATLLEIAI